GRLPRTRLRSVPPGPPPPAIYTLSLHDALPISPADPLRRTAHRLERLGERPPRQPGGSFQRPPGVAPPTEPARCPQPHGEVHQRDRKSTRLNSSHLVIPYAVDCLEKKLDILRDH